MRRTLVVAMALACAAWPSLAQDRPPIRDWPSARLRGPTSEPPPCSCRGSSGAVDVGGDVCIATPYGSRRARCVMSLNNTSWAVPGESCGAVAMLGR